MRRNASKCVENVEIASKCVEKRQKASKLRQNASKNVVMRRKVSKCVEMCRNHAKSAKNYVKRVKKLHLNESEILLKRTSKHIKKIESCVKNNIKMDQKLS